MRKLCIDEVGRVKMKKNEKKHILLFEKMYFLFFFLLIPLVLHFKDDF
jgi:hypothetical protein